jgi:hypothetical protein
MGGAGTGHAGVGFVGPSKVWTARAGFLRSCDLSGDNVSGRALFAGLAQDEEILARTDCAFSGAADATRITRYFCRVPLEINIAGALPIDHKS